MIKAASQHEQICACVCVLVCVHVSMQRETEKDLIL